MAGADESSADSGAEISVLTQDMAELKAENKEALNELKKMILSISSGTEVMAIEKEEDPATKVKASKPSSRSATPQRSRQLNRHPQLRRVTPSGGLSLQQLREAPRAARKEARGAARGTRATSSAITATSGDTGRANAGHHAANGTTGATGTAAARKEARVVPREAKARARASGKSKPHQLPRSPRSPTPRLPRHQS